MRTLIKSSWIPTWNAATSWQWRSSFPSWRSDCQCTYAGQLEIRLYCKTTQIFLWITRNWIARHGIKLVICCVMATRLVTYHQTAWSWRDQGPWHSLSKTSLVWTSPVPDRSPRSSGRLTSGRAPACPSSPGVPGQSWKKRKYSVLQIYLVKCSFRNSSPFSSVHTKTNVV